MKRFSALILLPTILSTLVPAFLSARPRGTVDVTVEWHSGRQTYIYVFKGVVSRAGRPVPNAKVKLHINAQGSQREFMEETIAGEDGAYQMTITIEGRPEESADWKLYARAGEMNAEAAEVEGRTILTSEDTVLVQRPLQLIQG